MLIYIYMIKYTKRICLSMLILFILPIITVFNISYSQEQKNSYTYTLIEPVNFTDLKSTQTDKDIKITGENFSEYLNNIYIYILVITALVSVFMIMRGGIMYLTTDIATNLNKGKEIVIGVISGLIFIFCIYLIFWLVNPELLKSNFVFKQLEKVAGPTSGGSSASSGGLIAVECDSLILDTKPVLNKSNRFVCKSLAEKLKEVDNKVPIIMTSAIRNKDTSSDCHLSNKPESGQCADVVPKNNSGKYDELCKVLKENGLRFLNESGQTTQNCGKAKVYTNTTGAHLHVIL